MNAIAPGYIATENLRPLREDANRNREILARIPAGRWGDPSDLAGAAVFLASAASDYVHGAILPVQGRVVRVGRHAQQVARRDTARRRRIDVADLRFDVRVVEQQAHAVLDAC